MQIFQKKFEISYAAIVFTLIFTVLMAVSLNFMSESVFEGYFMTGSAVSAMFLNPPPSEPYRWPISLTYGLLVDYHVTRWWQNVLIVSGAVGGALLIAFAWSLLMYLVNMTTQHLFYGGIVLGKRWQYARKAIFWNTALAASTIVLPLLVFIFIVVLFRQHALNKWAHQPKV